MLPSHRDYSDYPYTGVDTKPRGDIEYDDVPMEGDDDNSDEDDDDKGSEDDEDDAEDGEPNGDVEEEE